MTPEMLRAEILRLQRAATICQQNISSCNQRIQALKEAKDQANRKKGDAQSKKQSLERQMMRLDQLMGLLNGNVDARIGAANAAVTHADGVLAQTIHFSEGKPNLSVFGMKAVSEDSETVSAKKESDRVRTQLEQDIGDESKRIGYWTEFIRQCNSEIRTNEEKYMRLRSELDRLDEQLRMLQRGRMDG